MSLLTELAALRMQENRILAITCARCGHRLGVHSIATNHCSGELSMCPCSGWNDPGEQLALK